MANMLDEMSTPAMDEGRDTAVLNKQIPVKVGGGSVFFEFILWILGILPGLIFLFLKIKAKNYFQQLEQRIQGAASTIDNYMEQRIQVLQNTVSLVNKAVNLDDKILTEVAKFRSGMHVDGSNRELVQNQLSSINRMINVQLENYPDIKAHGAIAQAMKQNSILQKEITASRDLYNDLVAQWNTNVFRWPTKQIVAARAQYTTRIPFAISKADKEHARSNFFQE
ncbi:LemA family protein [Ureaplasma canigenitalium]|uniref:LemA family protein n=1 Tax=Ureaplasma canigenitalium TaxID=42092 RepID=UPI0004E22536|nr:LemA family protein [Ureaplasma canigenitalium]